MVNICVCTLLAPITCTAGEKIVSAAKKLRKHHLRHVYVVGQKKKLVGVFSAVDIIYTLVAESKDYRRLSVKDVMKKNIVCFNAEDPLVKAVGFMSQTNVLSVPIVKNNTLIGVLAYKDAIVELMKQKQCKSTCT